MTEQVGVGASFWDRRTNKYCDCPPARYSPMRPKPTNPNCAQHGGTA